MGIGGMIEESQFWNGQLCSLITTTADLFPIALHFTSTSTFSDLKVVNILQSTKVFPENTSVLRKLPKFSQSTKLFDHCKSPPHCSYRLDAIHQSFHREHFCPPKTTKSFDHCKSHPHCSYRLDFDPPPQSCLNSLYFIDLFLFFG
ncbi:hypothetical protein OROGR_012006 [Orobanche gracilis]